MANVKTTPEMIDAALAVAERCEVDWGFGLFGSKLSSGEELMRKALNAALATTPAPAVVEPVASIVPPHCSGSAIAFEKGVLHVSKDGSGYIAINEDDFTLEDDRCEGPDGPEGSVHWIVRFPAGEMTALRDFLSGQRFEVPADTALQEENIYLKARVIEIDNAAIELSNINAEQRSDLIKYANEALDRAAAAEERLKLAAWALEPFAEAFDYYEREWPRDKQIDAMPIGSALLLKHVRQARAALASIKGGENNGK